MANYLGKAQILSAANGGEFEDVVVPEWGGVVRVKGMSGTEKDAFESSLTTIRQAGNGQVVQKTNMANVRAKLLARSIVDENGEKIFEDADIVELGKKSAAALDRVVDVAKKLSRMSGADLKELSESLKNDQPAG